MASTRTTTRTIRIENEVAEYFKEKALNRAVESLYGLLTDGTLSFDGEKIKVGCTHQNSENRVLDKPKEEENVHTDLTEIESMAELMRVSTDKMLSDIRELLENGELYYSGKKLVNPRYEEFERLCEVKKQDPDKMMGNIVRQMGG